MWGGRMTAALSPVRARRLRLAGSVAVILVAYLVISRVAKADLVAAPPAVGPSAATTAFLDAYSRGDEVLAESLASPLYAAEWRRKGLTAAERSAASGWSRSPTRTLGFEFFGGVRSAHGFAHLLYGVHPAASRGARASHSVWRVDVDPDGRVVWLELVYLLGEDAAGIRLDTDPAALAAVAASAGLGELGVRPTLGLVSTSGTEGHYLVGLGDRNGAPTRVKTFTVDSDGAVRPGAWCFGGKDEPSVYPPTPPRFYELPDGARPLLADYLSTIF
jgi:hypothetical protein